MKPLADRTDLLHDLAKTFSVGKESGLFVPKDTTVGALKMAEKEGRTIARSQLEKLKGFTKTDILKEVQDSLLGREFQGGVTQGSRRVVAGTAIGSAVGKLTGMPMLGSVVGASTGLFLDTQGRQVAGKIIDSLASKGATTSAILNNPTLKRAVAGSLASALEKMKRKNGGQQ